jgi:hypothetical protein
MIYLNVVNVLVTVPAVTVMVVVLKVTKVVTYYPSSGGLVYGATGREIKSR